MTSDLPGLVVVIRRRVRLAGHVRRADKSVAGGGRARLVPVVATAKTRGGRHAATAAAGAHGAARASTPATARGYDVAVRADGLYVFLDVPAGDYTLSASDAQGRPGERRGVSIPAQDEAANNPLLDIDLEVAD